MHKNIQVYLSEYKIRRSKNTFKRFRSYVYFESAPDDRNGRRAIIDTGAPFSIIPRSFWQKKEYVIFENRIPELNTITSITGEKKPCCFGWVRLILADNKPSFSDWIKIPAKLAYTDDIPILLGVSGLLDTHKLVLNGPLSYLVVP